MINTTQTTTAQTTSQPITEETGTQPITPETIQAEAAVDGIQLTDTQARFIAQIENSGGIYDFETDNYIFPDKHPGDYPIIMIPSSKSPG